MNIANVIQLNTKLKTHRLLLLTICGILLVSNSLLSGYLFRQDSRTIIIPSHLNKEFSVSDKKVSEEYLELMARDLANMILNLTPDNYGYVESTILKHTHPDFYGAIKAELMELESSIKARNVAISFFMTEMVIDKEALKADVNGYVETRVGLTTVSREFRKYRIAFDYTGTRLSLKEFYEVKDDEKTQ